MRALTLFTQKGPVNRAQLFRHFGTRFAVKLFVYFVLIGLGFIFLYPVLYMFATSFMGPNDLISPYVIWIPKEFNLFNYYWAANHMRIDQSIPSSLFISLSVATLQALACAVAGYGLSRYKFRGQNIIFLLVLFTFLVPPEVLTIPLLIQFSKLGWWDTYFPFIVPALFGQGLRGALYVIIYRQFFSTLPYELEDAARIDGLGDFKIFARIMIPLSRTAISIVFLFSLVWSWNDYYFTSIFMSPTKSPVSVRLSELWTSISQGASSIAGRYTIENLFGEGVAPDPQNFAYSNWHILIGSRNEGLGMAACVLVIIVPLIIYIVLQRIFTESIERTGLVE
jgi:multiple sugar transport system permease protein